MKKRNTIVNARLGFINQDDTVRMVDVKTGVETIYENKAELNHHSEMELCKMTAKKAS